MKEHEGHKIGTIFGHSGFADYCLDCSKVLDQLTTSKIETKGKDNE